MLRRATALAALALLAAPAAATAQEGRDEPRPSLYDSKNLWATINVCDTRKHPDKVGIRGQMPGSGFRDEVMFMRFQLQYRRPSDGRWHNILTGADSGFVRVGSARFKRRQGGRTFTVEPPARGSFKLRGAVTFEWRRNGEVVRRARKRTTGGHKGVAGADPKGFSAATCRLS